MSNHRIENYCNDYAKTKGKGPFTTFDSLVPIVDTKSCFDDLRVGPDHVSRRPSDTYYVAKDTVMFHNIVAWSLSYPHDRTSMLFSGTSNTHLSSSNQVHLFWSGCISLQRGCVPSRRNRFFPLSCVSSNGRLVSECRIVSVKQLNPPTTFSYTVDKHI